MSLFHSQQKHKAQHGNYYNKPTKAEVNGMLALYDILREDVTKVQKKPIKVGTQLKLEF